MKAFKSLALTVLATLSLAACGTAPSTSDLKSGSSQLGLTGKIRVYQSGPDKGLQIDVRNVGNLPAYGASVAVNIQGVGFTGEAHLYPYFGGNTSTAFTVFPGDAGYVMLKFPAGVAVPVGQAVRVDVQATGASNFRDFAGTSVLCQKGSGDGCD